MKEMRKPIYQPAKFQKWICVYWDEKNGYDNAANFYDTLNKCSQTYNIQVMEPHWIELNDSKS